MGGQSCPNPIENAVNGGGSVTTESIYFDQDSNCIGDVSCTTFNILAPIYKRLNGVSCESEFREYWLSRNECILDRLLYLKSSIICLQEFWVGNEELVGLYERRLSDAGYATYKLARTNNRGDGLLTAVHKNHFQVLNHKELLFNDIMGDRVAQLLHVQLIMNFSQNKTVDIEKEALVVNTHLMFPHNSRYCFPRLQQVYKILQYIESFGEEYQLPPVPIILCGDWNGSKRGHVYKFLRSQGFVSSYDIAHHYTDSDEDAYKWVSHRNHRGNICGVDFIWLYNPDNHRKPLKESFMEAVLGNIKNHLHDNGRDITYTQFLQTFSQLGLTRHPFNVLSTEEIKELWDHVDTNGDGVIEYSLLDSAWNPCTFNQKKESIEESKERGTQAIVSNTATTIGFQIKNAVLFPPEVETGKWPENYSLSDHALLTVEFSPVTMECCL
ncbi:uncharacterized calcium-binding protein At1g02270-like isoform X2 [Telopea speciosissima]|uniref:uncharacterized calcium-binding protein At1g02270-like isoform X2 n=1 Tax=Telopea speciosissima TaxID=54955 RepID=UPI001CC56F9E|nr:uncharacterized calcium-binding protein At1g02270-like isoform X2 [Telopea speciosissima]